MKRIVLLLSAALLIPACGGGGGGGSPPGDIELTPGALGFAATEGGADPADQTVTFRNRSGTALNWTATTDAPWLTVSPAGGSLAPGASVTLTLSVDAAHQVQAWVGATNTVGAPGARLAHSAAWTGTEMIVWGGTNNAAPNTQFNTGGRYDPGTDMWTGATTTSGAPTARHLHAGVWTGDEMILWGGWSFATSWLNTGNRYTVDAWGATTETIGAPTARETTGVWTGTRLLIWGGWDGSPLQDGKFYDPVTNTWLGNTTLTDAPAARHDHVAVWTGNRMFIWGGRTGITTATNLDSGGLYDPVTDAWTATSTVSGPEARMGAAAVWTGREVIVWGGLDASGNHLNTGRRYDPATNTWIGALPTAGAPSQRYHARAVWTGTRMVVWGGDESGGSVNTGGVYRPPIPAIGSHTVTLSVTAPEANNGPQTVPISVVISP